MSDTFSVGQCSDYLSLQSGWQSPYLTAPSKSKSASEVTRLIEELDKKKDRQVCWKENRPRHNDDSAWTTLSNECATTATVIERKYNPCLSANWHYQTIPKAPEPTEPISSFDTSYFSSFLNVGSMITFGHSSIFPHPARDLYVRGVHHKCLRYSILTVGAVFADHLVGRPLDRYRALHNIALRSIQQNLQISEYDEGLAMSVFLMAWLDVAQAQYERCRKHILGMHLIITRLRQRNHSELSPLMVQIYRVGIMFDWIVALLILEKPIIPPIPPGDERHRLWTSPSTTTSEQTEWLLASFAMDILVHRACHITYDLHSRKQDFVSQDLKITLVRALHSEARAWSDRPIIQKAEVLEQLAQITDTSTGSCGESSNMRFLDFPVLRITNRFYANLHMTWCMVQILVSLITVPYVGSMVCKERYKWAVSICRTLAALGETTDEIFSLQYWANFLAGVAFGGSSQTFAELEWVMLRNTHFQHNLAHCKRFVTVFNGIWHLTATDNFWDEFKKRVRGYAVRHSR